MKLSKEAIEQYRNDGFYFPVRILDEEEAAGYRSRLEAFEAAQGGPIGGAFRNKSYLLFQWVDELMRNPEILNAVEDLIGPDILCWNTLFWVKEARSEAFVTWHQDLRYWGLGYGRADHRLAGSLAGQRIERMHAGFAREPSGRIDAAQR